MIQRFTAAETQAIKKQYVRPNGHTPYPTQTIPPDRTSLGGMNPSNVRPQAH